MSERKVLNKYYPPDFDPAKIPRLKLPVTRQYTVRLMAPCTMRCKTCGEYIYKGKKFNARKETVQNEEYLGIKVFRFYIKCTRCLAEITFKTDPKSADYQVEHGATRNFQAFKLAAEQAEREAKQVEDEEANNPMKLLENRTKASKKEMEIMEGLEELRDLNLRQANVDFDKMLSQNKDVEEKMEKQQEEEDEAWVQSVFRKSDGVKRLAESSSDDEEGTKVSAKGLLAELRGNSLPKGVQVEKKRRKVDGVMCGLRNSIKIGVKSKKTEPSAVSNQKCGALGLIGNYSSSDEES